MSQKSSRALGLLLAAMFVLSSILPLALAQGAGPRVLVSKDGLVWIDERRLTNNPSQDTYPQITTDHEGNSEVLWMRDGDYMRLRLDNVGRISAQERDIAAANPPMRMSNQYSKSAGIDGLSNISFIHFQSGNSNGQLLYEKYSSKAVQLIAPIDVAAGLLSPQSPNLVVLDNGTVYVTYRYYAATGDIVGLSILSPQGNLVRSGGNITNKTDSAQDSNFIIDKSGNVRMVFEDIYGPSPLGMYAISADKDGKTINGSMRYLYWNGGGFPPMPTMAACPDGSLHLLRSSGNQGGGTLSLLKLDAQNKPVAGFDQEIDITSNATDSGDLACDSHNNVYAVWADAKDGQLYYEKIPVGTDAKPHTPVRLTTNAQAGGPSLSIDTNDNLHIVWQDSRGGNAEIYYRFSTSFGAQLSMTPDQVEALLSIHPRETLNAKVTIKNLGGLADNFTLGLAINYNGFEKDGWSASMDTDTIEVGAQESAIFNVLIGGPTICTPSEHIVVTVNATSEQNATNTAYMNMSAYVECRRAIVLNCADNVQVTGAGQPTEFAITVQNPGDMPEDINLTMEGPGDWNFTLSTKEVQLMPRTSTIVTLTVTPPWDALANQIGTVVVRGRNDSNPDISGIAITRTMVYPMMALGMALDDPIHYVDPGNSTDFKITVTNSGNMPGFVVILIEIVSGVGEWSAYLSSTSVELAADKSDQVKLTVASPATALAGSRLVVRISATNDLRTQSVEITATTIINRVNKLSVETSPIKDKVDPGGTAQYQVKIMNLGNIEEVLTPGTGMVPSGWFLSYGSTEDPTTGVMVAPGATTNVTMDVQVPFEARIGNYQVQGRLSDEQGNRWTAPATTSVNQQYSIDLTVVQSIRNGNPGGSVVFDCSVRNFGNGPDLISLGTEGLPPGWGSRFVLNDLTVLNFTLGSLKNTRVSLIVSIPAKVPSPTQSLSVTAVSSGGFKEEVALAIDVGMPNIKMVNVTYSPSSFKEGKSVTITVLMKNTGQADCQNVTVAFYQDGKLMGTSMVKVFPAGTERSVTLSWVPKKSGDHSLNFLIDPQDQLGETDRKDNSMSQVNNVKSNGTSVPGFEGVLGALAVALVAIAISRKSRFRGENH